MLPLTAPGILVFSLLGSDAATTDIVTSSLCPCAGRVQLMDWKTGTEWENSTFGFGCARHEENFTECTHAGLNAACDGTVVPHPANCNNGGGVPDYCNDAWCYVDPATCKLASTPSDDLNDAAWSYAACGSIDSWSSGVTLAQSLSGQTLRVGFRTNSGGYLGSYHPVGHGIRDERWSGPTVEFVKEVAKRGGFYVNITEPPDEIKSNSILHAGSNSSFTQCVFATSLGYVDFCVGLFTITSVRNSMSPFFVVEAQPVYAVSREVNRNMDLTSGFVIIFRPFTPAVWLLFLFTIVLLNVVFATQEFGMIGSMFDITTNRKEEAVKREVPKLTRRKSMLPRQITSSVKAFEDVLNRLDTNGDGRVSFKEYRQYLLAVMESFYVGLLSITGGGVAHTAVSSGGRVTLIGFGVFILLAITQYTSTLTSQMVMGAQASMITSVDQAIEQGLNFCGERMDLSQMIMLYPKAHFVSDPSDGKVGFRTRAQMLPAIDSGDCDVAICALEDLQKYRGEGLHCDKAMIGTTPIYTVTWGMPLSNSLSRELAYHMNEAKVSGLWNSLKEQYKPASQCAQKSSNDQVALGQFFAVSSISSGIALLGFILTCVARGRGSRLRQTHPHSEPEETATQSQVPPHTFIEAFSE